MKAGEEKAWAGLAALDAADVCRRSPATYNPSDRSYTVIVFGNPVLVASERREIRGSFDDSELILGKLGYFSNLSILHYLIGARAVPPSGRLMAPSELNAGPIYFTGSHTLPLDALAAGYAKDVERFLARGTGLGGEREFHGDAAVRLHPLPRLPVTIAIWREDDEFPARTSLLFDATCELHVPPDILWSIAMLCVNVMFRRASPDAAS